MRWHHPERGLLFPDAFIPLAENTGLIRPLTLDVLDARSRSAARGTRTASPARGGEPLGPPPARPTLPERSPRLLERRRSPPTALELEITETTLMADPARAKAVLARLRAMGVGLAIDDFGTGYSSLG